MMSAGTSTDDRDSSQEREPESLASPLYEVIQIDEQQTLHRCKECGMISDVQNEAHAKSHIKPKSYMCNLCGKFHRYKENLLRHLDSPTGKQPYKCTSCGGRFSVKDRLETHVKKHADSYEYQFSGKASGSRANQRDHLQQRRGSKPYWCYICDQSYSSQEDLAEHMKIHQLLYRCDICKITFHSSEKMLSHRIIHEMFKCTFCQKVFLDNSSLTAHVQLHASGGRYKCIHCGLYFKNLTEHEKHVVRTHQKPYKSTTRGQANQEKKSRKYQKEIHKGNKLLICTVCRKSYRSEERFTRHLKIHSNRETQALVGPRTDALFQFPGSHGLGTDSAIHSPTSYGNGASSGVQPDTFYEHGAHSDIQHPILQINDVHSVAESLTGLEYLWAESGLESLPSYETETRTESRSSLGLSSPEKEYLMDHEQ